VPGQASHPKVIEAARRAIDIARRHGKKIATACAPDDFIIWLRLGIDLLFCTNDIACLKAGACGALKLAEQAIVELHRDSGGAISSAETR
jgi:2-keto-3-deoxy-L-rhamnonate aldolase RhmA